MFKIQKYLFLPFFLLLFFIAGNVYALENQINAGLLKNIWYSSTDIYEKDQIKIFGGIYNQSTTTFSGVAITYLDNKEIGRESFISKPESLLEVSSKWTAEKGRFSIQIKLSDIIFSNVVATSSYSPNSLLSSESDTVTLSVNNKITLEEVKTTVTNVATNLLEIIDDKANNLAEQILTLKKPVEDNISKTSLDSSVSIQDTSTANSNMGSVAGSDIGNVLGAETKYEGVASTGADLFSKIKNSSFVTNIYNKLIELLSVIVVYWKITLFVVIALILLFKFFM